MGNFSLKLVEMKKILGRKEGEELKLTGSISDQVAVKSACKSPHNECNLPEQYCRGQDTAGSSELGFHCDRECADTDLEGLASSGCLYCCPKDKVKALTLSLTRTGRSLEPHYKNSTLNVQKTLVWNNSRNVLICIEQKKKNENIKTLVCLKHSLGLCWE